MSSCIIDPYNNINSIGDSSCGLIDIFTNINSVNIGSGGSCDPGVALEKVGTTLNVKFDNTSIGVNGSNELYVISGGNVTPGIALGQNGTDFNVLFDSTLGVNNTNQLFVQSVGNDALENSGINFTISDGITLSTGSVDLGGTLEIGVDNTVIRTNKSYQLVAGDLEMTGDVTANSLTAKSDKRLKKEITPLKNSLNILKKVECYSYKWRKRKGIKRDNRKNFGVIAQQLEKIGLKDMVQNNEKFKSVNYIQLIPLLIESVKELTKRIEKLENKINKK